LVALNHFTVPVGMGLDPPSQFSRGAIAAGRAARLSSIVRLPVVTGAGQKRCRHNAKSAKMRQKIKNPVYRDRPQPVVATAPGTTTG
jgi:hypothetical protein